MRAEARAASLSPLNPTWCYAAASPAPSACQVLIFSGTSGALLGQRQHPITPMLDLHIALDTSSSTCFPHYVTPGPPVHISSICNPLSTNELPSSLILTFFHHQSLARGLVLLQSRILNGGGRSIATRLPLSARMFCT